MGAWEKDRLGWLAGVEVVGSVLGEEFVLEAVQSSEQALKIPLETGSPTSLSEYLLIEYRIQAGFDQDLPASGVLIYHIDPKIKTNRPCNSCPQQYMVELLEADGNNTLRLNFLQGGSRGEAGDAWGVAGSGRFTNSTYPSTRLTSGTASPVTIYDIFIEEGLAHITLSSVEVLESSLVQTFLETSGPGLTPEEVQYLDSYGNRNGQYDVGDLRAYLKR
jgi:immune inhibitor A